VSRATGVGKTIVQFAAVLALGGCASSISEGTDTGSAMSQDEMAQLSVLAAPYQDLQSVRLRPEDDCYWYRHAGPVETTMLPLRTVEGRPICAPRLARAAG